MHQAPLNDDLGPQELNSAKNIWISVHCSTFGLESLLFERLAEESQVARTFVDSVGTMDDSMRNTIHDHIHTSTAMQKGAIENHITTVHLPSAWLWWML
jgi:hypothetical protein